MKIYFRNPKTNHVRERICDDQEKNLTIREESLLGYTEVVKTYGELIKEFSTEWLKEKVRLAKEISDSINARPKLQFLVSDLEKYIEHISRNACNKGRGTSEKKAASSAANGRKGGRPKGSKNKPKAFAFAPEDLENFSKEKSTYKITKNYTLDNA